MQGIISTSDTLHQQKNERQEQDKKVWKKHTLCVLVANHVRD